MPIKQTEEQKTEHPPKKNAFASSNSVATSCNKVSKQKQSNVKQMAIDFFVKELVNFILEREKKQW